MELSSISGNAFKYRKIGYEFQGLGKTYVSNFFFITLDLFYKP